MDKIAEEQTKPLESILLHGGISTRGPLAVSRPRILRMPPACVTVIITSHYFIKDGAGICCHRHVTEC